ncbi:hypothetical protein [Silvanigrella aquatica]|uniref:Uncharacterized protein n=1 Tax=Silvanigrella aquatica TaxID=1915309 RepID=A0A1L4CYQ7_9BACT|nr:hypothetical protein [Silvanigrella aquatica]APJ03093.1 hypothetical protein AXG55_03890 [Silvanigrella aquatica]
MTNNIKTNKIVLTCENILKIISKYYNFTECESLENFVLPVSNSLPDNCGQILFEENPNEDELFIGIQFGKDIMQDFECNKIISLNSLAVVSEEISHFKILIDTVQLNSSVSLLEVEMLGEIDRFLCLMHWNEDSKEQKINNNWQNLHDICDAVFTGNRFTGVNDKLYIEAEGMAFKHLKEAFSKEWDTSHYDFTQINSKAKTYLTKMRKNILRA